MSDKWGIFLNRLDKIVAAIELMALSSLSILIIVVSYIGVSIVRWIGGF